MDEIGERVAVVETEVKNMRRTMDGVDEKLTQLIEDHSRMNNYERIGKQVYELVKIVLAALAGAWAAGQPWLHK